ncbi:histidine phosphatase family protein [soil metagenome]
MTDRRRLIVMRHAKAEPFAPSDHARPLTDRGLASALDAGAHLRTISELPDYALVSSALRTRQTWDAVVEGAGLTGVSASFDDAVFTGSPDVVLEVLHAAPVDASTVIFVGHNPTAAFLCHHLDDGEGDSAMVSEMFAGFPPGAMALLDVRVPWSELGAETATVVGFYVGQG